MKQLFAIAVIGLMLASCSIVDKKAKESALLSIGDAFLTKTQVDEVTLNAASPEDSAALADAFIKQWAEDVLFYQKATKETDNEIEALTANYRRTLYLHKYEEHLVKKEMPKDVNNDSITAFYQMHPDLFALENDIVKGLFIIIPNEAPNASKLQKWLKQPEENIAEIEAYAYQYATGYELFLDQWISENQINIKFPGGKTGLSEQLHKSNHIEARDSLNTYILQVVDKRFAGQTLPIEVAEDEIRNILLFQRRKQFLSDYREQLYKTHIKRNNIEQ